MSAENEQPTVQPPTALQMQVVPARAGWLWLAEGLRIFRSSPGMWTLLVLAYWLLLSMTNRAGWLGSILVAVCLPAFSASFAIACDELKNGRPIQLRLLFAGFQRQPRSALVLGAIYLLSMVAILGISALFDGGLLLDWILFNKNPSEADILQGRFSSSMPIAALVASPVLMAFWFAPLLVAFEGMSAIKALFYSFFACLRNWRALIAYGAAIFVFAIFVAMFVALFAVMAGGNANAARGFMLAATIMIMPALFGSFYAAYLDIFPRIPVQPEITPDASQL
ncbi:MAG: BPSS1780 family membrane protein [Burkholderiales bacterium]